MWLGEHLTKIGYKVTLKEMRELHEISEQEEIQYPNNRYSDAGAAISHSDDSYHRVSPTTPVDQRVVDSRRFGRNANG